VFSLFHAWNILKNEPKWAEDKGSKETCTFLLVETLVGAYNLEEASEKP
jgi:hypothetical protein